MYLYYCMYVCMYGQKKVPKEGSIIDAACRLYAVYFLYMDEVR